MLDDDKCEVGVVRHGIEEFVDRLESSRGGADSYDILCVLFGV